MTAATVISHRTFHTSKFRSDKSVCNIAVPGEIAGKAFVITGALESGAPRRVIADLLVANGAVVKTGVSKKTDVLLVAGLADSRYKYGAFGNKTAKALQLQKQGVDIEIADADEVFLHLCRISEAAAA